MSLTDEDRRVIADARELAAVWGADAIRAHTGRTDITMAATAALGEAQSLLAELVAIVDRLAVDSG